MKKFLLFFSVLILFNMQGAQARLKGRERIDSLLQILPTLPDDTNKVINLLALCKNYINFDADTGLMYGEKAYSLAKKVGDKNTINEVEYHLGTIYTLFAQHEKGQKMLVSALAYSTQKNDKMAMASILTNLSGSNMSLSNYPKAIEQLFSALKLFEATNDTNGQGNCLLNIGNGYLSLGDMTKALEYYHRALDVYESIHTKAGIALATGNIGSILGDQKKYDEAEKYYKESLRLYREVGDPSGIERNTSSLASLYVVKGYFKTALAYQQEAVDITLKFPDPESIGYNHSVYSELYTALINDSIHTDSSAAIGINTARALQLANLYADSAVQTFKEIGALNELSSALLQLSTTKKMKGDYKGALADFELHKQLDDSIFNIEKDKKITRTAMQYEFDKKEAAAKAAVERKEIRHRLIRNSIAAGLLGALFFLVVVYRQRNRIAKEKQRSEELLLNILPEEVAEELKAKGEAEAKQIDQVTVLFTDFKGFTQLSEKLTPRELVNSIHECFSAFDQIMQQHGIEKIKTIGDAYMAAGGLPTPNQTHPVDVVQAALDIQHYMAQHKVEKEAAGLPFFEIRIGIHTGPVVAGIVGVKKYSYDIWGDTVNTASRMESSGDVGKVNISGATHDLIKDRFSCSFRGKVAAKHKGDIDMYFVDGIR